MFLLTVIPVTKRVSKQELSYYSSKEIGVGALVSVPVRSKEQIALVIKKEPIELKKSSIRKSPFKFKKISSVVSKNIFSSETIESALETAEHYNISPGSVLYSLTPVSVLNNDSLPERQLGNKPLDRSFEHLILQEPFQERLDRYKNLTRQSFSNKRSVMIVTPTIEINQEITKQISKGIESFVFSLHSGLSKKNMNASWNSVLSEEHPVVIITTPGSLTISRDDLETVILEKEASSLYNPESISGNFSVAWFLESIARKKNLRLIFADQPLKTETFWRYQEQEIDDFAEPINKIRNLTPIEIISLSTESKNKNDDPLVGQELRDNIIQNYQNNEKTVIYTTRKGLAPTTVCDDCKKSVVCNKCNSPLILFTENNNRQYLCPGCGENNVVKDKCSFCGGSRLTQLGAGSEKIEESIQKIVPQVEIFRIDAGITPTRNMVKKQYNKFKETKNAILISTQMLFSHLPEEEKFSNLVVASLDTLFSIPDYSMNENIFRLILELNQRATKSFIVQTRMIEHPILKHIKNGSLIDFYREDIELRKQFGYPPFKKLIKISIVDREENLENHKKNILNTFSEYPTMAYPINKKTPKGMTGISFIIKLPTGKDFQEKLKSILPSISKNAVVTIDPVRIL